MKISLIIFKLLFAILFFQISTCYTSDFNKISIYNDTDIAKGLLNKDFYLTIQDQIIKNLIDGAYDLIWKVIKESFFQTTVPNQQLQQQNNIINDKLDTITVEVNQLSAQIENIYTQLICQSEAKEFQKRIQKPLEFLFQKFKYYYDSPSIDLKEDLKDSCKIKTGEDITNIQFSLIDYLKEEKIFKCNKYDSQYIRDWSEIIQKASVYLQFVVACCEEANEYKSDFDSNKFSSDIQSLLRYYKLQGFPQKLAQVIKLKPGQAGREEIENIFKQNLNPQKTVEKLREIYNYYYWQVIYISNKADQIILNQLNSSYSLCDSTSFGEYFNKTVILSWCITDPILGFQSIKILNPKSLNQIQQDNVNAELNYVCRVSFKGQTYDNEIEHYGFVSYNATKTQFPGIGLVRDYAFASSSRKSFNPEIKKNDVDFVTIVFSSPTTNAKTFKIEMIPAYNIKIAGHFKSIENVQNVTYCWVECSKETECDAINYAPYRCYLYNNNDMIINSKFENTILINHWPMSNNLNDKVGGAHLFGGGDYSFVNDRFSQPNSAIHIKGYLNIPEGIYFDHDFTISVWIQLLSGVSANETILNFSNQIVFSVNILTANILGSNVTSVNFNGKVLDSNVTSQTYQRKLNKWYHIVYTMQDNIGSIYVDGKLEKKGPQTAVKSALLKFNYIGRGIDNLPSNSPVYDDIKIYRGAMSPSEVLKDFNESKLADTLRLNDNMDNFKNSTTYSEVFVYDRLVLVQDSIIETFANKTHQECWTNCLSVSECIAISIFEPNLCALHRRASGFIKNWLDGYRTYSRIIL